MIEWSVSSQCFCVCLVLLYARVESSDLIDSPLIFFIVASWFSNQHRIVFVSCVDTCPFVAQLFVLLRLLYVPDSRSLSTLSFFLYCFREWIYSILSLCIALCFVCASLWPSFLGVWRQPLKLLFVVGTEIATFGSLHTPNTLVYICGASLFRNISSNYSTMYFLVW